MSKINIESNSLITHCNYYNQISNYIFCNTSQIFPLAVVDANANIDIVCTMCVQKVDYTYFATDGSPTKQERSLSSR